MSGVSSGIEKVGDDRFLLNGVINFDNAEALVKQGVELLKLATGSVVFDLSTVEQSTSVGLSVLLSWMRAAKTLGIQLTFVGMSSVMFDIARVSGLDDMLPLQRGTHRTD